MMRASAFAAAVVVLLAGCGAHDDADYFPLAAGAERTMRIETRVAVGAETTVSSEVRLVERVAGEEEVAGLGRVWVVESPRDSGAPTRSYFRRNEDAVMQVFYGKDSQPVELTFLSLPLTPGLRWYDTEHRGQVMEVAGRDTLVIAGDTFPDCYEVVTTSSRGEWSARQWLAPDVGPVQWEQRSSWTGPDGVRRDVLRRAEMVEYRRGEGKGPRP